MPPRTRGDRGDRGDRHLRLLQQPDHRGLLPRVLRPCVGTTTVPRTTTVSCHLLVMHPKLLAQRAQALQLLLGL
jgi:hypothetical protein